jgi:hypothetical protein
MTWWDEQPDERRTALTKAVHTAQGLRYRQYADGSVGFAAWLLVADRACVRSLGLSIFDLSDWAWRDAYDAGHPPGAAVREAVAADDTFGMLQGGTG